jgi:hypothetical protein
VPIQVGGEAGAISGTLLWAPPADGGAPLGLVVGVAGALIALCLVVRAVPSS